MGISLRPARVDIEFYKGTDFPFTATLTGKTDPVDLTGDKVVFTIFDQNGGVVFKQENTIHSNAASGQTEFLIPNNTTALYDRENSRWSHEIRRFITSSSQQYVHIVGEVKAS